MKGAVGVFDSGVGGLTVLSHIHSLLPAENLIYVADSAYMPYGCKSSDVVLDRCLRIANFFLSKEVKAIVIACNTATAVAVQELRGKLSIPVIGMEPAIKPAVATSKSGVIGVLATSGTVGSEKFNRLKEMYADQARLIVQPCPGLVERIEAGELESGRTRVLLESYLENLLSQGMDTLVLGCTHYPYLLPLIRSICGSEVNILDAGDAIARQLRRQLHAVNGLASESQKGRVEFLTSGSPDASLISRLWGSPVSVSLLNL